MMHMIPAGSASTQDEPCVFATQHFKRRQIADIQTLAYFGNLDLLLRTRFDFVRYDLVAAEKSVRNQEIIRILKKSPDSGLLVILIGYPLGYLCERGGHIGKFEEKFIATLTGPFG